MKNKIKVIRINNSVKYLVTAGITYRVGDTKGENLARIQRGTDSYISGQIGNFCNLVKYQRCNPNMKMQDAFESVVFQTKFN
jgi:hypothetical protein